MPESSSSSLLESNQQVLLYQDEAYSLAFDLMIRLK
jgi:hypothetical protein